VGAGRGAEHGRAAEWRRAVTCLDLVLMKLSKREGGVRGLGAPACCCDGLLLLHS